jgi:three-Cys-motif partner protein
MSDVVEREWGPWSVWKTEILLGGYLPLFTRAAQSAVHRTFIDCFAGVARNVERDTGREIANSPRLALEASPQFTHLLAFEQPENAGALETTLRADHPDRVIRVIGGDCNMEITAGLRWWYDQRQGKRGPYLGPTLAYLDPNSLELAWSTVETISRFGMAPPEPGAWVRQRGPIELLVLFPTGPLKRRLPQAGKPAAAESMCETVDRLFGSQEWRAIYGDQRASITTGEPSWIHYVNLYRRRLAGLGYAHTSAIEVRNTKGVVLYHMVFATSSEPGKRIMNAVMEKTREVLPRLLEEERGRRREHPGRPSLFAGQEDFAELEAISVDPERYAQLFTTTPEPYVPGQPPAPPPEQLGLEW